MTTELAEVQGHQIAVQNGIVSLGDIVAVSTQFKDIVKQQRMFTRIGDRDHILIEAWQTIASMTGVAAVEDRGVREIRWPAEVGEHGAEPPIAGPQPHGSRETEEYVRWKQADELHANWAHLVAIHQAQELGKAWGFAAAYHAVRGGEVIAAGEGRVSRSERTWASRDDYALASMAQTRGQSRALGAALRFIVKMAGYEPSLPDDGPQGGSESVSGGVAPLELTEDDALLGQAATAIKRATGLDGEAFVAALGQKFDGVPTVAITTLRGLATFVEKAHAAAQPPADEVIT
jgi:hypothetical protein